MQSFDMERVCTRHKPTLASTEAYSCMCLLGVRYSKHDGQTSYRERQRPILASRETHPMRYAIKLLKLLLLCCTGNTYVYVISKHLQQPMKTRLTQKNYSFFYVQSVLILEFISPCKGHKTHFQ